MGGKGEKRGKENELLIIEFLISDGCLSNDPRETILVFLSPSWSSMGCDIKPTLPDKVFIYYRVNIAEEKKRKEIQGNRMGS